MNQQKTGLPVEQAVAQVEAPVPPAIHKGPVEGVLIVDGRPQVERADLPCISFDSILAIQRFDEEHSRGEK